MKYLRVVWWHVLGPQSVIRWAVTDGLNIGGIRIKSGISSEGLFVAR